MKKVAVLGSGVVGETLAAGFIKHGHEVMRGSREPAKLADWKKSAGPEAQTGTFAEAAKWGDLIVLAVKGDAAESALELAGAENTAGKTVIDTTNPIADAPVNGVLPLFHRDERVADGAPPEEAAEGAPREVLLSVGAPRMVNPDFGGTKPSMFICGNDEGAKKEVKACSMQFGWETEDMGARRSRSRHRAALHPVVHPRLQVEQLDARVQGASLAGDDSRTTLRKSSRVGWAAGWLAPCISRRPMRSTSSLLALLCAASVYLACATPPADPPAEPSTPTTTTPPAAGDPPADTTPDDEEPAVPDPPEETRRPADDAARSFDRAASRRARSPDIRRGSSSRVPTSRAPARRGRASTATRSTS